MIIKLTVVYVTLFVCLTSEWLEVKMVNKLVEKCFFVLNCQATGDENGKKTENENCLHGSKKKSLNCLLDVPGTQWT